jgi:hypothetical protein
MIEKLRWGKKVVGLRVHLARKAPKSLLAVNRPARKRVG